MWVFLNNSFFSVVEHKNDPHTLVVRARVPGDLERAFGNDIVVIDSEGTDYKFRTYLTRDEVSQAIAKHVDQINYTNFKDSIKYEDKDRKHFYTGVWVSMMRWQKKLFPPNNNLQTHVMRIFSHK